MASRVQTPAARAGAQAGMIYMPDMPAMLA